jgi:predicted metal-binding protein
MKDEELQWQKAAVFICTKCGKAIPGAPEDLAEQLKSEFKSEMKSLGLAKDIRVMTSSCLDICEVGYQAVALIPKNDASKAVVKVFDPVLEKELLRKEILKLKDLK